MMKLTILLASSDTAVMAVDEYYVDHPFVRGGVGGTNHRKLPGCEFPFGLGPCCGAPDPCWCDRTDVCPSLDDCPAHPMHQIYTPSPITNPNNTDIINFFSSLGVPDNTDYAHLQLCHPKLSCGFDDPYLLYNLKILDKESDEPCSKLRPGSKGSSGNSHQCYGKDEDTSSSDDCDDDQGNEVCGIKFIHCDTSDCNPPGSCTCTDIMLESHGETCGSEFLATNYEIRNFKNDKKRQREGFFVLHEGACGLCSTAQDMAAYMTYSFPLTPPPQIPVTLETITIDCYIKSGAFPTPPKPIPAPDLVENITACIANGPANFTENCAFAWAINMFSAGLNVSDGGCVPICDGPAIPNPPYNSTTCELDDCLACDEEVNGQTFTELAGMTRRGAGIHTALPRPCGSLAEHKHTCVSATEPI